MVNRRHRRRRDGLCFSHLPALIFLTGCFGIGLLFGCVFASCLKQGSDLQLSSYLESYFSVLQDSGGVQPRFLSSLWEMLRWPLAVSLLGTTALGALAIPAILCLRGFLLSYTVSVFVLIFGTDGLLLALAIFGISAILSVASLFVAGIDAFELSRTFGGRERCEVRDRTAIKQRLIRRLLVIVGCLIVGTIVQNWLSPILLKVIVDSILSF